MKSFVLKICIYLFAIFALSQLMAYILKEPLRDAEKRNMLFDKLRWQDFYAQQPNSVDVLFLGSSHAFRSFNPQIIDSITGSNSFVMGSGALTPITSYYILKNILVYQKPKTIVLENYFFPLFYEKDQLDNGGMVYDNLRDSPEKHEFFVNGFNLYEKCALTFAPVLRYKGNYEYVIKKLFGMSAHLKLGTYLDKGYVELDKCVKAKDLQSRNMFDNYYFDSSKLDSQNVLYFKKIIELCEENNMRIILFTCPVPEASYKKIKNPQDLDSYFKKIAMSYNVEYYNYLDPETCGIYSDTAFFSDYHHLNKKGAEIVSRKVSEIILNRH